MPNDHHPARQDRLVRHPHDPEEAARAIGAAAGEDDAEGVMAGRSTRALALLIGSHDE
jgi:hypothetical protein